MPHPVPNQSIDRGLRQVRAEISGLAAHRVARCSGCGRPVMVTEAHVIAGRDVLHTRCAAEQDAARRMV